MTDDDCDCSGIKIPDPLPTRSTFTVTLDDNKVVVTPESHGTFRDSCKTFYVEIAGDDLRFKDPPIQFGPHDHHQVKLRACPQSDTLAVIRDLPKVQQKVDVTFCVCVELTDGRPAPKVAVDPKIVNQPGGARPRPT